MRKRISKHRKTIIRLFYSVLVCTLVLMGCSGNQRVSGNEMSMDCSVYKTIKTKDYLKFQLGYMQVSGGIDLGLDREEAIDWDSAMQKIIARYLEACSGYNAGMLTKDEYDQKIQGITLLSKEARELEQRIIADLFEDHNADIEKLRSIDASKSTKDSNAIHDSQSVREEINHFSEKL